MSPRILAAALGLALIIGGLGALAGLDSCRKTQEAQAEHNAAVASGEAVIYEASARKADPAIQKLEAERDAAKAVAARVTGERDALLKKWKARPIPPATVPASGPDDRTALLEQLELAEAIIAKDAETIEAKDLLIKNQSELILVANKRGDDWEAACHARERQALAQEAATKAWKDAVTTSRWRGRVEGFAAGVALGYVGGRR